MTPPNRSKDPRGPVPEVGETDLLPSVDTLEHTIQLTVHPWRPNQSTAPHVWYDLWWRIPLAEYPSYPKLERMLLLKD